MGELLQQFNMLDAFWMTINITAVSAIGSLLLGTFLAVCRLSPVPFVRLIGSTYVNVVRNTPLTLVILGCQMGLFMSLGLNLADPTSPTSIVDNNFRYGCLGLSLYTAAFVCEALRSGVNTVPPGQAEAARSLGLGFFPTLRYVIFPQAFRAAIAPLGNVMIALTKNTTVVSVIGVAEVSFVMAKAIEDRPDALYSIFAIVSIGFIILTLPMGMLFTHFSRTMAVQR